MALPGLLGSSGPSTKGETQSSEPLVEKDEAPAGPADGSAAIAEKRHRTHRMYRGLMAAYVFGGMLAYYLLEGWDGFEGLVFTLSVLTGVGYGHLRPESQGGMVFTVFYILAGLVLFASIAGQILDYIMASEISAVLEAIRAGDGEESVGASYRTAQTVDRKRQFLVGCANLALLGACAVLLFMFAFGEDFVPALYQAAISVLKLDSVCLLKSVECSHAWHTGPDGSSKWLIFSIFWSILTFGTIGHFLVSASSYLGIDPEASVSQITQLSKQHLERMDADGNGRVTSTEFLRDRLLQDGHVEKEVIDEILRNFDSLDKDRSGHLSKTDMAQP